MVVGNGDRKWMRPILQTGTRDGEILKRVILVDLRLAALVVMAMKELSIENIELGVKETPPSPPLTTLSP